MDLKNSLFIDDAMKILNPYRPDLEPVAGARDFVPFAVRSIDKAKRRVTAWVSTENEDRYEEIILAESFRKWLPTFMTNPVLLAGHAMSSADGKPTTIGRWVSLNIEPGGLVGTCEFMANDELAEAWWQRYLQGVNKAFSVGILVHAWDVRAVPNPANGTTRKLRVLTECELIEISAVNVPANREAIVRNAMAAYRAAAFDGGSDDAGDDLGGLSNRRLNKVLSRVVRSILRDELRGLAGSKVNGLGDEPTPQQSRATRGPLSDNDDEAADTAPGLDYLDPSLDIADDESGYGPWTEQYADQGVKGPTPQQSRASGPASKAIRPNEAEEEARVALAKQVGVDPHQIGYDSQGRWTLKNAPDRRGHGHHHADDDGLSDPPANGDDLDAQLALSESLERAGF